MPIDHFPFTPYSPNTRIRPLIPIVIFSTKRGIKPVVAMAVVDSAADFVHIPFNIAKRLGWKPDDNDCGLDCGTQRGPTTIHRGRFRLTLHSLSPEGKMGPAIKNFYKKLWTCKVHNGLERVLLGRDFLQNYLLIINYPEGFFSIKSGPHLCPDPNRSHCPVLNAPTH